MPGLVRCPQNQTLQCKTNESNLNCLLFSHPWNNEADQNGFGHHGTQSQSGHEFAQSFGCQTKPLDGIEGQCGNDGPDTRVVIECYLTHIPQKGIPQQKGNTLHGRPGRCRAGGTRGSRRTTLENGLERGLERSSLRQGFGQNELNVNQIHNGQNERTGKDIVGMGMCQVSSRHGSNGKGQAKASKCQTKCRNSFVSCLDGIADIGKNKSKGRTENARQTEQHDKEWNRRRWHGIM
mmetsp:Transcript_2740/g.6412  ORF Transcript_2740/g.6412 Transcript_2740/m.6412 type:complete len:236 (+) Transcript_2740:943-1650(+)